MTRAPGRTVPALAGQVDQVDQVQAGDRAVGPFLKRWMPQHTRGCKGFAVVAADLEHKRDIGDAGLASVGEGEGSFAVVRAGAAGTVDYYRYYYPEG